MSYQRAPYIQPVESEVTPWGEALPEPFESAYDVYRLLRRGGQYLMGNGAPQQTGGIVLADQWNDLFTPSGNMRGTVGVIQPTGKLTFVKHVGQPTGFSRMPGICKGEKKRAQKMISACGGTRRKR